MNPVIAAAALSWFAAQTVKMLCGLIRYGSSDRPRMLWRAVWAGGMPSAHSALITASALAILSSCGVQSPLFGLTWVMACIVIYDRSRMYAIYATFQKRYPDFRHTVQSDPLLQDLIGHRLCEILAGVLIGLGSGYVALRYL